jgi:hypothetical protein
MGFSKRVIKSYNSDLDMNENWEKDVSLKVAENSEKYMLRFLRKDHIWSNMTWDKICCE